MKKVTETKFKQTEAGPLPEDWQFEPLDNFLERVTYGFTCPMPTAEDGPYMITAKDLEGNKINYDTARKTTPNAFKERLTDKSRPRINDVLLSKDGTLGRVALVDSRTVCINQSVALMRPNGRILPEFLYYLLLSRQYQRKMKLDADGTVIRHIYITRINRMGVGVPKDEEQRRVTKILLDLDSRIELNRKMNRTLEAMGKTIFKHWFIEFEFPNEEGNPYKSSSGDMVYNESLGMEIPEDWSVSRLGGELQIELGGTPDRTRPEFWNGDVNWINSGKVNEFRIVEPSEKITREGLVSSATKLLPKGTVVLAITGATLGQVSRLEINSCANQSVVGIVENAKMPSEYLYFWIKKTINDLVRWRTGGAQQHINKGNVENSIVLIPSERIMQGYTRIARPIFEKISSLCVESLNLAGIRDLLLPKLISGKIRVPAEAR